MARIDPRLIARLRSKLDVGPSHVYRLIDQMGREKGLPRHLAAVALAASRGINISRFATEEYYAAVRGGRHPADAPAPAPPRPNGRGKPRSNTKPRKPGRRVFVVHGRDEELRRSIFDFLRAVNLLPIEWSKARAMTGKPNPVISEILDVAFARAEAVVVVLSPEDEAKLADHLVKPHDLPYEKELTGQPRQNVLWEGGMAYAHSADRTVVVQVGEIRPFTDISGHHVLRLTDGAASRKEFVARLRDAGCDVDEQGEDWLRAGKFEPAAPPPSPPASPRARRRQEERRV